MEISELNRVLRNKAIKHGMCESVRGIWNRDLSYDELYDIFIKNFDFSVDNDWLDYDFCKEVIPIEVLHRLHVYIDEELEITDTESGYCVFLGHCNVKLTVSGFKAVTVYCRHNSVVNVTASDGARVFVRYYDQSTGECNSDSVSKIRKYVYHKNKQ